MLREGTYEEGSVKLTRKHLSPWFQSLERPLRGHICPIYELEGEAFSIFLCEYVVYIFSEVNSFSIEKVGDP